MFDTTQLRWAGILGVAAMLGCSATDPDSAGAGGESASDGGRDSGDSMASSPGSGGLAAGKGGMSGGVGGQAGNGASRGAGGGTVSGHAGSVPLEAGSAAVGGGAGAPAGGGSSGAGGHAASSEPGGGGSIAIGGHAGSGAQNTGGTRVDAGPPSEGGTGGASGISGDSGSDPDPCAGGTTYPASTSSNTPVSGYGWVLLYVAANNNQIIEFETTMVVPPKPRASGTLFLWPGLQPRQAGANFKVLDNGVLQPVLTWGPTCAPHAPDSYKSWWISGQYVNTYISSSNSNYAAYNGCHGGPGMDVEVGDSLDMRFVLAGTDWTQTVTNRRNSKSVSFTIDMLGQAQNDAEFVIEEYSSKPVSDVTFTSSVVTFASAAPSGCRPVQRGKNDYFSAPRASADGRRCCISKVILRAEGVDPTTPDSP